MNYTNNWDCCENSCFHDDITEPCPIPIEFELDKCQDSAIIDLKETNLISFGRIIQIDLMIKGVCPNKRVALAVILTEVDSHGKEYSRGMKTLTIPAHNSKNCKNIKVKCLSFVVPEDLNVSGEDITDMCSKRYFKARILANYIDTDFVCCDGSMKLD